MKYSKLAYCAVMLVVFVFVFFGCSHNGPSNGDAGKKVISLIDKNSNRIGEAVLTPVDKGVRIQLQAEGLPPGTHGFHFHDRANCQAPTFESAGEHFSPDHTRHGNVAQGPHAGDMDNITVGRDGKIKMDRINTHVTLTPGRNSLLKNGGTALVIHSKSDDYMSQPAGNSGDRIACGVIMASAEGIAGQAHRDDATP